MDPTYKLQVKLGPAEFNAEGPEVIVKDAFERFLAALSSVEAKAPIEKKPGSGNGTPGGAQRPTDVDRLLLDRVFSTDHAGTVSLRLLPPEGPNRAADAAILLMYGFRELTGQREVPVMKLTEGLRQSGFPSVRRVDRFIGVHNQYFMKGGTRSGGRYTLTHQGIAQAASWLQDWFK